MKLKEINQKIKKLQNELTSKALLTTSFDFQQLTNVTNAVPEVIKIGTLNAMINGESVELPAFIPFANSKGLCIEINDLNRDMGHIFLQYLCLQLINQLPPHLCKLSLVDTKNLGANFKFIKNLDTNIIYNGIVVDEASVRGALDENFNRVINIVQDYLLDYQTLSEYNQHSGSIEPYRFLVISNFPYKFNREHMDRLLSLLDNGKMAGFYVLMTYDPSIQTNNHNELKMILNSLTSLKQRQDDFGFYLVENSPNQDVYNELYNLKLDNFSTDYLISETLKINNNITENETNKVSIGGIRVPIGKVGNQIHEFTLGFDSDNYHAIIGGQSGKGKSVLLNAVIANGIRLYTPDQLRLVLCDCKGTEFSEYKDIDAVNHVQVFCSSSDVEKCIKVVQFIEEELKRREELFSTANAKNIDDYVSKTGNPMPRLLCIIDEFQVLFTGSMKNTNYVESILVTKVLRVGRSFGIHLVVCTQSLGDGVRKSFLDNIPLRVALGMTPDQSASFLGINNTSAGNLQRGKAVYNSKNGDPKANKIVNIDFLSEKQIEDIISISNTTSFSSFDKTKIS